MATILFFVKKEEGLPLFLVSRVVAVEKMDFLGFPFFSQFSSAPRPLNSPPSFFHCRVVFIGEVWLGHNHIDPSTLFFLYFEFILKTNNTNIDSIRKISDCKINTLKVERVRNTFENLNYSKMTLKMLKTMQIYQKCIFWVFIVFCYFCFFSENLSKTWVKNWVATNAPSLQCLRSKNSSMFCIVSL